MSGACGKVLGYLVVALVLSLTITVSTHAQPTPPIKKPRTNPDLCPKYDNRKRASCLTEVAANTNNSLLCEKIHAKNYKEDCIIAVASTKNDPHICDKYKQGSGRADCLAEIAAKNDRLDYCNLVKHNHTDERGVTRYYREECIQGFAQARSDPHACMKLDHLGGTCLKQVALQLEDPKLCEHIPEADTREKGECYLFLAKRSDDPHVCDMIKTHNVHVRDYRTTCFRETRLELDTCLGQSIFFYLGLTITYVVAATAYGIRHPKHNRMLFCSAVGGLFFASLYFLGYAFWDDPITVFRMRSLLILPVIMPLYAVKLLSSSLASNLSPTNIIQYILYFLTPSGVEGVFTFLFASAHGVLLGAVVGSKTKAGHRIGALAILFSIYLALVIPQTILFIIVLLLMRG